MHGTQIDLNGLFPMNINRNMTRKPIKRDRPEASSLTSRANVEHAGLGEDGVEGNHVLERRVLAGDGFEHFLSQQAAQDGAHGAQLVAAAMNHQADNRESRQMEKWT